MDDNRATYVVMRPSTYDDEHVGFHQLVRVPAVTLFRDGKPLAMVDTSMQKEVARLANKFVCETELRNLGMKWLGVPPHRDQKDVCMSPPSGNSSSKSAVKDQVASHAAAYRKRKKAEKMQKLHQEQLECKRVALEVANERKKQKVNIQTHTHTHT